jgi:hypothetical protein
MLFDRQGILLADVPNAGVARRDLNAKSGNPNHDVRSGKFGSGGKKPKQQVKTPANVDPLEYARMIDAIRDAARQLPAIPEVANVEEFLKGRAKSPETVDIRGFIQSVMAQKKADLVDLLDQQLSGKKNPVKVTASAGYLRGLMKELSDADIAELMHRLESRGHKQAAVDKFIKNRIGKERYETAASSRDSVAASDDFNDEGFLFFVEEEEEPEPPALNLAEIAEAVAQAAKEIQPPEIHVHPEIRVELPAPKPTRREIIRDEKTGLAVGVREVPDE